MSISAKVMVRIFQVLELYSQRIGCSVERQQNFPGMVRKVKVLFLEIWNIGCSERWKFNSVFRCDSIS